MVVANLAAVQFSDSLSRHSSVQGESDSESESLIHTITNKLGSIFTTDSSEDADVSETDDNDESLDWTLDKPIFLTPQGPVKFRTGLCQLLCCRYLSPYFIFDYVSWQQPFDFKSATIN